MRRQRALTQALGAAWCAATGAVGISATTCTAQDAAAPEPQWVSYAGGEGPGAGKHIVLISGDEEYRSEEALPQLAKILAERHGFACTVLFALDPDTGAIDPDQRRNIPGLDQLADADLMVIFTRFRELPDAQMRHIDEYVRSGRPIVGLRTATHAFAGAPDAGPYARYHWRSAEWPGGFGRQVLGETWVAHHGKHGSESTRGVVEAAHADHPILRGVGDVWGPTDVYRVRDLPDDTTVLLRGAVLDGMERESAPVPDDRNDPMMPLAWVRARPVDDREQAQRVFATTMGAATDLSCDALRRLLVNACYWCVELEAAIDAESDMSLVGDYQPTPFGFGGFVKGVRPAAHVR
ncbi:MAG: ThuA domain-containing protein [Planctomycetota bacterium]